MQDNRNEVRQSDTVSDIQRQKEEKQKIGSSNSITRQFKCNQEELLRVMHLLEPDKPSAQKEPASSSNNPTKQDLSRSMTGSTNQSHSTSPQKYQDKSNQFLQSQFELERDRSLIKFMDSFYQRYTMMFYSDSEKEKAAHLKVKVKIEEGVFARFTRNELDDFATSYRLIYKSFCNLRTYLSPSEIKQFDDQYTIEKYYRLSKLFPERSVLIKLPLKVHWKNAAYGTERECVHSLFYLTSKLFPTPTLQLINEKVFGSETTEHTVLFLLFQKHHDFVDYMMRSYIVSSNH